MASSSKKDQRSTLMTAKYIDTIRGFCTYGQPTAKDIIDIFKELHGFLSKGALTPSSSSSRGGKRRTRDSAIQGSSGYRENFDRPCTCKPGEKQCWLASELEPWNRVLSQSFMELREHSWGELVLQGFKCLQSDVPGFRDVLRTSLLVSVLLQQHRCVTKVVMNTAFTNIEMPIFWHSLQNGGAGVRYFEFTSSVNFQLSLLEYLGMEYWSQSTVCLPALHSLLISRILFDEGVARTLGGYLERTTTLKSIAFHTVEAECKNATVFLDHLARNRTVTSLLLQEHFVMAQGGQALASVLKNHAALENLEIHGRQDHSPSAVLRAAVQSSSLKSLSVHWFAIRAEDIEAMAAALTRRPPSYAILPGAAEKPPRTQTSRLERLAFFDCIECKPHVQAAYGTLIGGVLVQLKIKRCFLGEVFALVAACQLRTDSRLRVLDVKENVLPVSATHALVQALEVNSTLKKVAFDLSGLMPEPDLGTMFDTIREIGVRSRIEVDWYEPRPSDVSKGGQLCSISGFFVELKTFSPEDVATILEPLASGNNVISACIRCTSPVEDVIVQQLVDALGKTKSLRRLSLRLEWPENSIVDVLRSLELNRSVRALRIIEATFTKRSSKALARLVEVNRTLDALIVCLKEKDSVEFLQHRAVCRALKEAVPRNRFLTKVVVNVGGVNHASDFVIMEAFRRNSVLRNQAGNFVKGSNDKKHAQAFETLQYFGDFREELCSDNEDLDEAPAKKQIDEACKRLALNYFIFTGVVKAKIVCHPHPKRQPTFDKLSKGVQAHICSYLSLSDVMDI
ncbi:hypothetical protein V5799_031810 [Amblyomma americanum]|uniref:Nlr family card domain protein n=1 Tax=Amblyomma americanum TaxID=6943 RepID=A0AAQ4DSZ2_AMBAM